MPSSHSVGVVEQVPRGTVTSVSSSILSRSDSVALGDGALCT